MTTINSVGFFLFGVLMSFLPAVLPGYFPPSGMDGANTSALWLEFMGILQGSLGAFFGLRNEARAFAVRLATVRLPRLQPRAQPEPAVVLRPAGAGYLFASPSEPGRIAA